MENRRTEQVRTTEHDGAHFITYVIQNRFFSKDIREGFENLRGVIKDGTFPIQGPEQN